MNFGDKLRELIEERAISQKQLARDLNISPSTMGNYIQNTREPDFETVKLFAGYFKVTLDYLLGYASNKSCETTEDEIELLRIFRSLTKEQQEMYLEQGKLFIRMNNKKEISSSLPSPKNVG